MAVPAADILQADIHRTPTAAAAVAVAENVDSSRALRRWNCGRGCPFGHCHVSWTCGMKKYVGCRYFRSRQSFDCASKTEPGEAIEEPLSSCFRWLLLMDATDYLRRAYHAVIHGVSLE